MMAPSVRGPYLAMKAEVRKEPKLCPIWTTLCGAANDLKEGMAGFA